MNRGKCLLLAASGVVAVALFISRREPPRPDFARYDTDWDLLRQEMLAARAKIWTTHATLVTDQVEDFDRWFLGNWDAFPITMPEVAAQVRQWLASTERERSETIRTFNGMLYECRVNHYEDGADCEIRFAGSTHWKAGGEGPR